MSEGICGLSNQIIHVGDPVVGLIISSTGNNNLQKYELYSFTFSGKYLDGTILTDKKNDVLEKESILQAVNYSINKNYKDFNLFLKGLVGNGFNLHSSQLHLAIFHQDIYQNFLTFSKNQIKNNLSNFWVKNELEEWKLDIEKTPNEETVFSLRKRMEKSNKHFSLVDYHILSIFMKSVLMDIIKNKTLEESKNFQHVYKKIEENLMFLDGLNLTSKFLTPFNKIKRVGDMESSELIWQALVLKTNFERTLQKTGCHIPEEDLHQAKSLLENILLGQAQKNDKVAPKIKL